MGRAISHCPEHGDYHEVGPDYACPDCYSSIYARFKSAEQDWIILKDQYSELCRAAGIKGDAWFGDPLMSHEECVAHIKRLADKARPQKMVDPSPNPRYDETFCSGITAIK